RASGGPPVKPDRIPPERPPRLEAIHPRPVLLPQVELVRRRVEGDAAQRRGPAAAEGEASRGTGLEIDRERLAQIDVIELAPDVAGEAGAQRDHRAAVQRPPS